MSLTITTLLTMLTTLTMLTALPMLTCSTYHCRVHSSSPPMRRPWPHEPRRRSPTSSCRTPTAQSLARTTWMRTCSIVLPKVPPPLHRPPPRPYLPVPACVCPRVPTPTPFPMPSCARCYHGQVEPAGGPRARFVGPAPAQQLPKQPPHGVYCAPHAQIVSTCAIPAAIPAAIRAALPATTLRAPPPRAATLRAAALRAAALRAAAPRAAALRAAAILAAAFRAAALRAVPACISSSEGGVQCVPLPHSVPHHPPSPHTTACHTDHTHHTHRTCHTHRTSHPPFSHSLYLPYSPHAFHSHHSPILAILTILLRWSARWRS
jgi:hypothetical protein